jgi:Ni/Co efflux regulator RcnB
MKILEGQMKTKAIVCAVMAITMGSAQIALAQGRGERGERGDRGDRAERRDADRRDNGADRRDNRADRRDNRAERRDFNRHDDGRRGPPSWANNRHDVPNGYHRWNRGDRLPAQYRDRQYIVSDWRGHRLSAPPRGYQWVQSGSDYLLVAVATGIILQLLTQ